MAGDWIKMRGGLWDHPKVVRIVSAICPQSVRDLSLRCRVIGALYRTWALADAYTDDGILDGYTTEFLDEAVGIDGWSQNLAHVGWLTIEPQRLILPQFENHNGASAKRRAEDAIRKQRSRKASAICPKSVRKMSAKSVTREEKRRVYSNTPISPLSGDVDVVVDVASNDTPFDAFWAVVHSRVGRAAAERAYAKAAKHLAGRELDPHAFLRSRMEAFAQTPAGNPVDHTPVHPATWLNQGRYDDDPAAWSRVPSVKGSAPAAPRKRASDLTPEEISAMGRNWR